MSENVGLSTPRGSGTSGYVTRNLAAMRPRDRAAPYPKNTDSLPHKQRQPDQGILDHDRKREIEVKVFELRDKLEDDEYVLCRGGLERFPGPVGFPLTFLLFRVEEDEIDSQCDELRRKLLEDMKSGKGSGGQRRQFQQHQVHAMADAKIKESERLRRALKISSNYEEGSHWRKQEERLRESVRQEDEGSKPKDGDD